MENELYHHGIKGQRWGIRRYQNKDGSLTPAGKKRVAKLESEYSRLTGKKTDGLSNNTHGSSSSSKTKNISEMSNEEIQDRIDRIRLENTLKSLTPEHVSTGQKFVNGLKDATISIAKDKGTRIIGDYVDKQIRDKLGLNTKDAKTVAQILQEEAQKYENRQKIDKGQRYFKEGKYAETKKEESNQETYSGTVEGEGRSKSKTKSESTSRKKDKVVDSEGREVNDEDVQAGEEFIAGFLEDKKRGN